MRPESEGEGKSNHTGSETAEQITSEVAGLPWLAAAIMLTGVNLRFLPRLGVRFAQAKSCRVCLQGKEVSMSRENSDLRISIRRLLILLMVTVVPFSVLGLFTSAQSENAQEKEAGMLLKTVAEGISAETSRFIHNRVLDIHKIAVDPAVVDTINAANRGYQGMSEAAVTERIAGIEKTWNTPASEARVKEKLSNSASRLLRRHRTVDPRILRITVTDQKGATIAATHKTLDYFQADEEYWQNIHANGRGAVSLTDILYDEVTKSNYIGVGVPVLEEGSNTFIGTVDALIEVSSLFPIITRAEFGETGRAALVKEDGTVISAPNTTLSMRLKSDEYTAVKDRLTTLSGRQTGYLLADLPGGGRNLIGFADTGLKEDYRSLGWTVLVSQSSREAFAGVRTAGRLMIVLGLGGLAAVTLLAVFYGMNRRRSYAGLERSSPSAVNKATV
ncbi:MAG: hypothetical protein FJW20_12560 [Acidimicrobiia bacterium]|nr:hypothetical protein [Acidimicrobiia bacterium]